MITQEEIQKAYQKAPQHIQEWIDSDELSKAFETIRTKYNLHLDHAGNLAVALDAVILELKRFDELSGLLKEGLIGLDDSTRDKVLKDVNDMVFIPLRELVKKHAEEVAKKAKEEEELERNVDAMILADQKKLAEAEAKLKTTPPPAIAPAAPTQAQGPAPVLQQKMGAATAEQPVVQQVPPPVSNPAPSPAPTAPPRYHGTDPYREPPA